MQLRHGLVYFLTALAAVGCTVTSSEPGAGAPAAETGRCKNACDKMKFFKCSSAAEQAACYADCDSASASQIEVFTACAENSICDPACRTSIQPAERAEGGGGASAATCETACSKLVSCNFIPVGAKAQCNAECSTKGYQYQIDCVNSTACGEIVSTCGGGSSSVVIEDGDDDKGGDDAKIAACFEECDSINFFECAPVALHGECRDRCTSASATKRESFTSCSKSSGVNCENKAGCLDAFLN